MYNTAEVIMEIVNEIQSNDEGGLLGFCVREIDDSYSDTGNGILHMFEKYHEHAELFEEFLGYICGMNLDDIVCKMDGERDYYNSL